MIPPASEACPPRVLLITRNFPPLRGGMERLNERLFRWLCQNNGSSALVDREARARFRRRHGIAVSAPVLLSVGRMTARKGLAEFVDRSLPSILAVHPTARLVIVGDQAEDALHRGIGSGMEPIQAAARAHGIGDAVLWLGPCSDAELADAFQGADLHVFPVRDIPVCVGR